MSIGFRTDINGLRSIAVIGVVFFHFFPSYLTGGFSGVDVFFVISGFLMTKIIYEGVESGNFNILRFYYSRLNRILPPLLFLCVAVILLGLLITPYDYSKIGKHAFSSLIFLSNIVYWKESGYFDASSLDKWLLHTWSLSVEWQFYILFPLIIVVFLKFFDIKFLKYFIFLGLFLSFTLGAVMSYYKPQLAYFLLPTRGWELLFGSVVYFVSLRSLKFFELNFLVYLGLFFILVSYVFITPVDVWPGYLALLPVLGSGLIVLVNARNNFILNNSFLQRIGLWSYSIYLWHWPIVVFGNYYQIPYWGGIGIFLSVAFGMCSYIFIEKRLIIRFKNYPIKFGFSVYALFIILLSFCALFVKNSQGLIDRFEGENRFVYDDVFKAVDDWDYPDYNLKFENLEIRYIDVGSKENILFIGASHIEQIYPYILQNNKKYNIYFLTNGGCLSTPSYKNPKASCSNIKGYKKIVEKIGFKAVVTSTYCLQCYLPLANIEDEISLRAKEYNDFLIYLNGHTEKLYLILPEPRGPEFDPVFASRLGAQEYVNSNEIINRYYTIHNKILGSVTAPVSFIDPIDFLCPSDLCPVKHKGRFIFKDDDHFRASYAKNNLKYLDVIIN